MKQRHIFFYDTTTTTNVYGGEVTCKQVHRTNAWKNFEFNRMRDRNTTRFGWTTDENTVNTIHKLPHQHD